jgi:glycosyltransferase involved in cell wall biosynthesis
MGSGKVNIYLINLLNSLKSRKCRVGFVISGLPLPYGKIMASTRIRVYDVIKMFWKDKEYLIELYNPFQKYDIVIFQKKNDQKAFTLAKKLKKNGTKIVLDTNVNYYNSSSKFISKQQTNDIVVFSNIADRIIVPTKFLQHSIKKMMSQKEIDVIEESIDKKYFRTYKKKFHQPLNLIWSGYAIKASELLLIKGNLETLYKKFRFNLFLISEKNPNLKIGKIPIYFIKYHHSTIVDQLLKGDIFAAPRDLSDSYNLGHSFTKIGVAMAVGLPVIASPVPSYRDSPAILCDSKETWDAALARLFREHTLLNKLSKEGRRYVQKYYSPSVIKMKYIESFNELLKKEIKCIKSLNTYKTPRAFFTE